MVNEGDDLMTNKYGQYEMENVNNAKEWLLNSILSDLKKQLYQNYKEDASFIALWLNLVHIVKSVSINRFDMIKKRIEGCKVSDYVSENIEELVMNYYNDWEELHDAELFDFNLTLKMMFAIMEAGNEEYRYPLHAIKSQLKAKLVDIHHLSYTVAHQELVQSNLGPQSILSESKRLYRNMLDKGKWPAASHAINSKALNKGYGKVKAMSEVMLLGISMIKIGGQCGTLTHQ